MIGRRGLLTGAVIAAGGAGLAAAKAARDPLTAVDVHPNDYPTVEAVRWLGRELERETRGRLSIRLYPGGQLGAETDTVALARYQVIDFCRVTSAALNNAFPKTRALTLPFTFVDEGHMRRVVDSDVGAEIRAEFERRGLIGLCLYDGGARSMYTARRAIHTPRDMHGLKVRVPRSNMFMEMIDAMGANATPIPFGEVFTGLQTHLIDAAENNWSTFESTRQYEVARYWSETQHCHSPDALLFSKARYDRLSRADQDLLRAKAAESVTIMRALWDAKQTAARATVLADGVAANTVDRAAFVETAAPMRRRYLQDETLGALMRRIESQA